MSCGRREKPSLGGVLESDDREKDRIRREAKSQLALDGFQ